MDYWFVLRKNAHKNGFDEIIPVEVKADENISGSPIWLPPTTSRSDSNNRGVLLL